MSRTEQDFRAGGKTKPPAFSFCLALLEKPRGIGGTVSLLSRSAHPEQKRKQARQRCRLCRSAEQEKGRLAPRRKKRGLQSVLLSKGVSVLPQSLKCSTGQNRGVIFSNQKISLWESSGRRHACPILS